MPANIDVDFSVVVPLYNKRPFIRQTIESVRFQDHPASEIIVVDDGSTDGSLDELSKFCGPGFRICRQSNAGAGAARNHGFRVARHSWVALLDGDDLWMPNHLSTLATLVRACPSADLVSSKHRSARGQPPLDSLQPTSDPCAGRMIDYFAEAAKEVGSGEAVWTSTIAIRRDAFMETAGFGLSRAGDEDQEFWARLALTHAFATSPNVTAVYVMSTGGLMDIAQETIRGFSKRGWPAVFPTLDRALDDPRHVAKHPAIRSYRTKLFEYKVDEALRSGLSAEARWLLARCPKPRSRKLQAFRLLALFPGSVSKTAFKAHDWLTAKRAKTA